MSMAMPKPDQSVIGRRAQIVAALRSIVPGEGVIAEPEELRPYESDGLTACTSSEHLRRATFLRPSAKDKEICGLARTGRCCLVRPNLRELPKLASFQLCLAHSAD